VRSPTPLTGKSAQGRGVTEGQRPQVLGKGGRGPTGPRRRPSTPERHPGNMWEPRSRGRSKGTGKTASAGDSKAQRGAEPRTRVETQKVPRSSQGSQALGGKTKRGPGRPSGAQHYARPPGYLWGPRSDPRMTQLTNTQLRGR
jgi:hypothetical protein